MTLKTTIAIAAALAVLLPGAGCALLNPGGASGSKAAANGIKLGVLSSFSGTSAQNGPAMKNAVALALQKLNAAGGPLGRPLEVEIGDDQSDPAKAAGVAAELVAKGVVAIIGPNGSGLVRPALLETAVPKEIAMISPAATSPALTNPAEVDGKGWFFRTVPHDGFQGRVLARKAAAAGHKKLAVIHVDNAYGQGLATSLKTAFTAEAGRAAELVPYAATAQPKPSYAEEVGKALGAKPDAVVLIGYPGEATVMINDWRAADKTGSLRWYFTDALQDKSFVANVADQAALEGQLGTAPATDPAFTEAYKAAYGDAPKFSAAAAYDAATLVGLAIEAARSTDRGAIRAKLRDVSAGGQKFGPGQAADALRAVKAGQDVDYDGYAGAVDFDANGDVGGAKYDIWTVKAKQIVSTGEILTP